MTYIVKDLGFVVPAKMTPDLRELIKRGSSKDPYTTRG